jgi:hypothetical protein
MKRLLTFLSVLGWLLIIYWGLPPSLFSVSPTAVVPEVVMPEAVMDEVSMPEVLMPEVLMDEPPGGHETPRAAREPLHRQTVAGLSRNLLVSSAGFPLR